MQPNRSRTVPVACIAAAVLGAGAAAGCGGDSSSSKPAYCSEVSALEKSIKDFNVHDGLSGVQTQLKTIQNQATTTIAAAKSDFPDQADALKSSVSGLSSAIDQLSSSPSVQDVVALAPSAKSVKDAGSAFLDATKSKC